MIRVRTQSQDDLAQLSIEVEGKEDLNALLEDLLVLDLTLAEQRASCPPGRAPCAVVRQLLRAIRAFGGD